jgi:hypothetical protein
MNPQRSSAIACSRVHTCLDRIGESFESAESLVEWRRHRCREITADAVLRKQGLDGWKSFRVVLHAIKARPPVDVQIDKGGGEHSVG